MEIDRHTTMKSIKQTEHNIRIAALRLTRQFDKATLMRIKKNLNAAWEDAKEDEGKKQGIAMAIVLHNRKKQSQQQLRQQRATAPVQQLKPEQPKQQRVDMFASIMANKSGNLFYV